jgi:hypothetical protein
MITYSQNREFLVSVVGDDALDDAIEWIGHNLIPEDVFSVDVLTEWAYENGYSRG